MMAGGLSCTWVCSLQQKHSCRPTCDNCRQSLGGLRRGSCFVSRQYYDESRQLDLGLSLASRICYWLWTGLTHGQTDSILTSRAKRCKIARRGA